MNSHRNVYLDHSASTPTDPRVVDAMIPYFSEVYGNPSAIHAYGRKAEQAIEDAREVVASVLNCKPGEIVFTSCGSESDNLAIRGAAWIAKKRDGRNHLITSPVEHPAVSKTVNQLSEIMSFDESILPVDHYAMMAADDLRKLCREDTILASIIYANNEVGTIAPIRSLADVTHNHDILFHTDAVQAAGQMSLDTQALGVDMLSISAHKFYGPKGVGALFVRDGIELTPSQSGGSHEEGRRSGTHNTAFIVGLAEALKLAHEENEERMQHFTTLSSALREGVLSTIPDAELTGHPEQRLPSHNSFVFHGVDGNQLLMHLDMQGIAASSGSACKTGNPEPSEVLLAMGYDRETALSSLRLTVGKQNTLEEIEYTVDVLQKTVEKLRKLNRQFAS